MGDEAHLQCYGQKEAPGGGGGNPPVLDANYPPPQLIVGRRPL